MSKTLHLTLRRKWFDMILSGVKLEEYRELKEYWQDRFMHWDIAERNSFSTIKSYGDYRHFDTITFRNGYSKNAPEMVVECLGITIGRAVPEWSDNWPGECFVIKLGKIISITNNK